MKMMRLALIPSLILTCTLFLSGASCNENPGQKEIDFATLYPDSTRYTDLARFISGMDLSPESPLAGKTATKEYIKYKTDISAMWQKYTEKTLEKIIPWRDANIPAGKKTIFYPFSGPDILNAMTFFPSAEEVTMIGLEYPGDLPVVDKLSQTHINRSLLNVKNSLRTLLDLNFFRTLEMEKDFRGQSFSNITGIMMFFLSRSGFEILDFQRIMLNETGDPVKVEGDFKKGKIRGIQLSFRKPGENKIRKALFLSMDLSNKTFNRTASFQALLKKKKDFTALIKSASYLMGNDDFSGIRNYILKGAELIVQCDSGIPYKHLNKKIWDIELWGKYRVLEMFKHKLQKDLAADIKKNSKGQLEFSYGYGFWPVKSHVMIVKRKPAETAPEQQAQR